MSPLDRGIMYSTSLNTWNDLRDEDNSKERYESGELEGTTGIKRREHVSQ